MLIYEATKGEFQDHILTNSIVDRIQDAYSRHNLSCGNKAEIRSWENSLQRMNNILSSSSVPDDAGVAIEFRVPLTNKRIDFIISGYDDNNQGTAVIVELKQWSAESTFQVEGKDALVETFVGGAVREVAHPSYQVWSYYTLLKDFNESVQSHRVELKPCAYLHNFTVDKKSILDNDSYSYHVQLAPLYFKEDAIKLKEFIEKFIKKGDQKKNLYEIENGKLKPSKSLQESIHGMLEGNQEFVMIDSQKVVFENALAIARKSQKDKKKRVMIVEGGPGTGKSVIAINLLAKFIQEDMVSQYISKNAAPRNVYSSKLKGKTKARDINHLFRGSGSFVNATKNMFSSLIVDEAHRLNEKSGLFRNQGENQIKEIINAANFTVLFIDEDQRVDIHDIGSKEETEKIAKELKASVSFYELDSQFRCGGSDGYLAWLDDVLGIRETANADGFDLNYEIKIFDDPNELRSAIEEKNKTNDKSRVVAGYCWDWPKEGKNDPNTHEIRIDDFAMSWNLGNTNTWSIDKGSIKEAGCIHTCQGLEFDYVGVIIGEDLRYEKETIITDHTKRAKTDQSLRGIKKLIKENPAKAEKIADRIIRNTYRTLMTRGQKGCYIYCCDKKLSNYLKKRLGQ